jgi:hypothetical protein
MVLLAIIGTASAITATLFLPGLIFGPNFVIQVDPTSQTILVDVGGRGNVTRQTLFPGEALFNITLSSIHGFNGVVSESAAWPTGFTGFFLHNTNPPNLPASITPFTPDAIPLANTPQTIGLTAKSAFIGNYTVIVTATSGSISHSVRLSIIVQGLGIRVSPAPLIMTPPSSPSTANIDLTLTSVNGIGGNFSIAPDFNCDPRVDQCLEYPVRVYLQPRGVVHASTIYHVPTGSITTTLVIAAWSVFLGGSVSTTLQVVMNESLQMKSYSFSSPTNATLYILNNGPLGANLMAYKVTDGSVNQCSAWRLNPSVVLPQNSVTPVVILLDGYCSWNGNYNAFMFVTGHSYTVTLQTSRYNSFDFTVVR